MNLRFISIHPDIFDFSWMWHLCKVYPQKLQKCFVIARYIAEPNKDVILCDSVWILWTIDLWPAGAFCPSVWQNILCKREFLEFSYKSISCPIQFLLEQSKWKITIGYYAWCSIGLLHSEEQYTIFLLMCIDLVFDLLFLKAYTTYGLINLIVYMYIMVIYYWCMMYHSHILNYSTHYTYILLSSEIDGSKGIYRLFVRHLATLGLQLIVYLATLSHTS
jgi:hypothetical protein